MFEELGKTLIFFGLILILVGGIVILISKAGGSLPFGRLPGDIYIKRDNFVFFFPIGTSILISVLLTLFFYVIFLLTSRK
jgi:hypothetical protein